MKLKVVGWTYYDNTDVDEGENGWAATNAVIDEIKKKGYLFSGYDHQEGFDCAPILNDGKMRRFSQRGFGGIMAEAHGYTGRMDYALFSFGIKSSAMVTPDDFKSEYFVERHLSERFTLEVSEDIFKSARAGEIKLDDLSELRYIDEDDVLELTCCDKTAVFQVADVDRKKDITDNQHYKLEAAFHDFNNPERQKRAEEYFDKAKIILVIKLKKCQHTCETYLRLTQKEIDDPDWSNDEEFDKWVKETDELRERWFDCRLSMIQQLRDDFSAQAYTNSEDFFINRNTKYNVDINEMIRKTIGCFVGKEQQFKDFCEKCAAEASLVVVPCIKNNSNEPKPKLSIDSDIEEFLQKAGVKLDLDEYVL